MTYRDYLDGKVSHEEYYRSVNRAAGLRFDAGTALVEKVKQALARGDEHLNTIPLVKWDFMGCNPTLRTNLAEAFKEHGDFWSMAGSVCCLKQAAKDAAMGEE